MNHPNRRSYLPWAVVMLLAVCAMSCKSHKKAMEATNIPSTEKSDSLKRAQDEAARQQAAEAAARREAEANKNASYTKLDQYFNAIAQSNNVTSANQSIQEALTLFASDQAPVLIVISQTGGQKDYDRPTTIGAYMNYLKDQKKNLNKIQNLEFDESGKIKSVELVRK